MLASQCRPSNGRGASAALVASLFHYGEHTVREAKAYLRGRGVAVRP